MSISYPLALPSTSGLRQIDFGAIDVVGLQESPLTLEQTTYDWGGDTLTAEVALPPMDRADAEVWVAFLLALRGRLGTFLMGDPLGTAPRGTWAGTPLLVGAHAAGLRTLSVDGFSAGATGKQGDWIQFGSGASTRLHKVLQDFTADGSGAATIEIYPRLRADLADNAALNTANTKGRWRLATNRRDWSIGLAQKYGVRFTCVEALDG